MKLLDTFIYKGIKRVLVEKPIFQFATGQCITAEGVSYNFPTEIKYGFVNYGIPYAEQSITRVTLSELEQDIMVGAGELVATQFGNKIRLNTEPSQPPTATIIEWPFGEVKQGVV